MLKKSTWLALGFAAVSLPSAFSQTVIFSEDFENGMPANFSLFNVDGGTPDANISFVNAAWVVARNSFLGGAGSSTNDLVAVSTSWYDTLPSVASADDWMFTPAITVPNSGTIQVRWNAKAIDSLYADGYEVRIMTTAPTAANLSTSTVLWSTAAENPIWTTRSTQQFTSYAGQTVYIAFRNNSANQFLLAIDDIEVVATLSKDVAVLSASTNLEYAQYPLSQFTTQQATVNATVANFGTAVADTVQVSALVIELTNLSPIGSTSSTLLNFAAGDTTTVATAPTFTAPASIGVYTGIAMVSTSNDLLGANDTTFIQPWMVTDTVYARDRDTINRRLGVGLGEIAYLGNSFDIIAADTATSVSILFTTSDSLTHTTACVWATDSTGTPTSIVARSMDTVVMNAGWQTFRLPANTILSTGKYIVAAVELDSALAIGASSLDFLAGTSWINATSLGGWSNLEDFGFNILLAIRLNLGHTDTTTISVNKVADNNALSVMPNPSNGVFNIRLDLQEATDAEIVVTSIDGKQVRREQLGSQSTIQRNIDLSELANGVYVLQVRTTKGTYTQRITKQ